MSILIRICDDNGVARMVRPSGILAYGARILARGSRWLDRLSKMQRRAPVLAAQLPSKLNLGCGYDKREGYLNVDVDSACAPDLLIINGDYSAIPRRHFTEVLAKDVLEHIPRSQSLDALLDFADYLLDGGKLIIQTTSILDVATKLRATDRYADHHGWTICLFGNQAHPGDFHYTGFTEVTLQVHLLAAGFTVELRELREQWMLYIEAKKTFDWASIVESSESCSDAEFLQRAYQAAFYRDADETGRLHFGKQLQNGVPRKLVLKQIFSAPERLFRIADLYEASS